MSTFVYWRNDTCTNVHGNSPPLPYFNNCPVFTCEAPSVAAADAKFNEAFAALGPTLDKKGKQIGVAQLPHIGVRMHQ